MKQTQPKRKDPVRRFHDAAAPWTKLLNRDPGKHYVYVHLASDDFGRDYYESIGYEAEIFREGGARPALHGKNLKSGDNIELRGHLLMSMSKELHAELEANGPDGISGQNAADERERKMTSQSNGDMPDGLRGRGGKKYFSVVNETTPATPE